jgi:Cft2 family RNA processing exonuclease
MKIKVLSCCTEEFGHTLSSFLVDDRIFLDAGCLMHGGGRRRVKPRKVFVTHGHLDHITAIPFLAEHIYSEEQRYNVEVFGTAPVVKTIKASLLNGSIWPDFTVLPEAAHAILKLVQLKIGRPLRVDGYRITPYKVSHTVPAVGFLVECQEGRRLFYTGDTGPSDHTWSQIGKRRIDCLITEVSFPNALEDVALLTGHLTPRLLAQELLKIAQPPERIYVTGTKPRYLSVVRTEVRALKMRNLRLLEEGQTITV